MDVKFKVKCNSYAKIYIRTSLDNYESVHQLKSIFGIYSIRFIVDPNLTKLSYTIYTSPFYQLTRNYDHSQMIIHNHHSTRFLKSEKIMYESRQNKKWVNYFRRLKQLLLREKVVRYI
ncbi:hypothetical protein COBT_001173 [Conglomerata obtusa]